MKVYTAVNHSNHSGSKYWRILGVFKDRIDAKASIQEDKEKFLKLVDYGDFGDTFEYNASDPDEHLCTSCWDEYIISECGDYECWRIEVYELLSNYNTDSTEMPWDCSKHFE